MEIDQIATTKINDTTTHLLRDEFGELLLAIEHWEEPNNPGPQADPNCIIIRLTEHPLEDKLKTIDKTEECDQCGKKDNFTYFTNAYLETNPNYLRTHTKEKYCTDCAEQPRNTLLKTLNHFKKNIAAVEL